MSLVEKVAWRGCGGLFRVMSDAHEGRERDMLRIEPISVVFSALIAEESSVYEGGRRDGAICPAFGGKDWWSFALVFGCVFSHLRFLLEA